jgi:hypothetical protein
MLKIICTVNIKGMKTVQMRLILKLCPDIRTEGLGKITRTTTTDENRAECCSLNQQSEGVDSVTANLFGTLPIYKTL